MKVISYSLFGYNEERKENCFIFSDYLRGLHINIRLARILYNDWVIRVHVDQNTYDGLNHIFKELPIQVVVCKNAPLTKAMLWRMMPIFDENVTHTLCRDLDSPLTFRERQAVEQWLYNGKVCHAITDSISHNIPLMGGMIGFNHYFKDYAKFQTWDKMMARDMRWDKKGVDQLFLQKYIYPFFAKHGEDSITQHYVLGMPNTFLSDYYDTIADITIPVDNEFRNTNDLCGHIGASGYYSTPMNYWLKKYSYLFEDLNEVEKKHKDIYYWQNESF